MKINYIYKNLDDTGIFKLISRLRVLIKKAADNAYYGIDPHSITVTVGDDVIEIMGYIYEPSYEAFSATASISLNGEMLFGENSRNVEAYRNETYKFGKCNSIEDALSYLKKYLLNKASSEYHEIKVLLIEVGKAPQTITIDGSLKSIKQIVGDNIMIMYMSDKSCFLCNKEDVEELFSCNLFLYQKTEEKMPVIKNKFIICSSTEEDENFSSITDELIDKYSLRFKLPEKPKKENEFGESEAHRKINNKISSILKISFVFSIATFVLTILDIIFSGICVLSIVICILSIFLACCISNNIKEIKKEESWNNYEEQKDNMDRRSGR